MVGRAAQVLHMASADLLMSHGKACTGRQASQISIIKTSGLNSGRLAMRGTCNMIYTRYLRIREFTFVARECSHLYQFFNVCFLTEMPLKSPLLTLKMQKWFHSSQLTEILTLFARFTLLLDWVLWALEHCTEFGMRRDNQTLTPMSQKISSDSKGISKEWQRDPVWLPH